LGFLLRFLVSGNIGFQLFDCGFKLKPRLFLGKGGIVSFCQRRKGRRCANRKQYENKASSEEPSF